MVTAPGARRFGEHMEGEPGCHYAAHGPDRVRHAAGRHHGRRPPGDLPWAAASWVRAGDTGDRAMAIVVVLQVGGRRTEPGKGDRIARGAKERRSRLDRRGDRAATGGGRRSGSAETEATVCPDGARTGARYGA